VVTRWTVECGSETLVGEEVGVKALGPAAASSASLADGQVVQQLVLPATPRFQIPAAARAWDVAGAYVRPRRRAPSSVAPIICSSSSASSCSRERSGASPRP
jgi:hypothetical protein